MKRRKFAYRFHLESNKSRALSSDHREKEKKRIETELERALNEDENFPFPIRVLKKLD